MTKTSAKRTRYPNLFDPIGEGHDMVQDFMKAADDFDRKMLADKKKARKFMIEQGFITKSGRLTKRYGG